MGDALSVEDENIRFIFQAFKRPQKKRALPEGKEAWNIRKRDLAGMTRFLDRFQTRKIEHDYTSMSQPVGPSGRHIDPGDEADFCGRATGLDLGGKLALEPDRLGRLVIPSVHHFFHRDDPALNHRAPSPTPEGPPGATCLATISAILSG